MDSLKKMMRLICFAIMVLFFIIPLSCKTIEGVRITNDSTHTLSIQAFFGSNQGDESSLHFTLKPGDSDFWQYEAGRRERKMVDYTFKKLLASDLRGCSAEYDRKNIEEAAQKNGMWNLVINNSSLTCN